MPKTAPAIVIDYWRLPKDVTLKDVVTVIRTDEDHHRDVNHFAYPWETYQADLSVDLRKHHVPKKFFDNVAYWLVKLLRIPTNLFFKERYSCRAIILKTVAGVPGMVGGVYERITMFCDVEKSLKEIESHFDGTTLNLHGSIRIFSKIEKMLREEITHFEKLVLVWTLDLSERDAHLDKEATKRWLKNNFVLMEITCTRSPTELVLARVLDTRSKTQLNATLNHYKDKHDEDILKGITTEVDLKIIVDEYQKRDNIYIDRTIGKDTRGDYESMLLALLGLEEH
ncbi:Ubiquinol oxidase 2, mitochondrial [Capsicum chinense]|nr:Ubiquinol oxidase 2, mitochondrial [Capsicum chinense]